MAPEYKKDIIVVETGYPHQSSSGLSFPVPFPESPEGQRELLKEVNRIVMMTPNGLGKGVFWWEPAAGAGRGFFDRDGNALPVLTVFDKYTRHTGKRQE